MDYLEKLNKIKGLYESANALFQECLTTKQNELLIIDANDECIKHYISSMLLLDDVKGHLSSLIYALQALDSLALSNRCSHGLQHCMYNVAFTSAQDRRLTYNILSRQYDDKLQHYLEDHTKSHFDTLQITIHIVEAIMESLVDGGQDD